MFVLILIIFFVIFLIGAGAAGFFYFPREKFKNSIVRSLNMKLLLITLPPAVSKDEKKTEKEIISIMDQLYSALLVVKKAKTKWLMPKPYIALEMAVPQVGEELHFYLACPWQISEAVSKQIYSYYPTAKVEEIKDYTIFQPGGASALLVLSLSKSQFFPFKTYKELEADPLKEISNAFSKLKEKGEGAALQILIRPAGDGVKKKGLKISKLLKEGKSLGQAMSEVNRSLILNIISFFLPSSKKKDENEKSKGQAVSEEIIKALENKASRVQFETNIRLVAAADNKENAEEILRHLENSFAQFNSPILNNFNFNCLKKKSLDKALFNFAFRIFDPAKKIVLSSEELTSIYHLPNNVLETPKIKILKAKPSEPPANLPKTGLILGKNLYRGEEREARILTEDRRRHFYLIGQTGTGKTAFMKNMIAQDIENGQGVGVLDPHGEFVEDILGLIPKSRAEDVVLIDPADLERPLGLNMLEYDPKFPEQKTFIVNELIGIFDKLYDLKTTGGPIFEQYTRNALLLLMEYPEKGHTIMEIPKVLADKEFRKNLLTSCKNIIVKDFWEKEAEKAGGEAALQNTVPYITSKFNVFIANDYMRPVIGQSKSTINFREIMDSQKILLVNLSKGKLGDINSSLLGLIVVGKLLMASFSRIDVAEEQRKDFYLYLDEFQNFATNSIATILSEARKYRLDLIIAHQFIEQLKKEIKDAVFGNVGSVAAFRVGAADAEILVKQFFEPVFNQNDLVNIDNFNAYIRLMISNTVSKPFSIASYPPKKGNPALAASLRELSRLKYGRSRQEVEADIMDRWR